MRKIVLKRGANALDHLVQVEEDVPRPGPGEVLVRVRACSLNYRDQMIALGRYVGGLTDRDVVPLSDGAGEIVEAGADVRRFRSGDRVAGTFFRNWYDGLPHPAAGPALGAPPADGMLADYVVLPERGVVPIAASLSFEEAATLPCAGVTAWHALMEGPRPVRPGGRVLVLGTGGVSLLALQIARAAGAEVIVTSSSDAKLVRAGALGASHGINYRTQPDWGRAAVGLAGDAGIGHVVETGGVGTLAQSMEAVGFNGEIALIGVMTVGQMSPPYMLMGKGASIRGIFVGSGAMAERLNAAIDANGIKPAIDRVFPLEETIEAYRYQASDALFGKVVIRL